MRKSLFLPLALLPFLLPLSTSAQVVGDNTPLTLILSPQYPRPYDVVTITPSSNAIDLANAATVFYVNGTKIATGSGGEPESIQMGGAGVPSAIRVVATIQGTSYEGDVTVEPADVALVTEPDSTTHPFYEGGAAVASEGIVHFVAIPDFVTSSGSRISSSNLVYTWKVGEQLIEDKSGIGRSTIDVTAPVRYRDATVSVTVTTEDGSMAGYASVDLSPANTIVRLYDEDPLLGALYDNAIGSAYTLNGDEDTLLAVPYFFSSEPSFAWTMNGDVAGAAPSLTMRQSGSGSGTASVGLVATLDSFSTASASTQVSFGGTKSGGLFGL